MDEHRPWGWRLVNHGKYVRLRNMAQKREADRTRIADKRNKNKDVASESQSVANVAHSDSDSDLKNKVNPPPNGGPIWKDSLAILTASGFSEQAARGFLGLLCRDYSEEEIVNAVKAAMGKSNVAAYIRGVLRERPKKGQTVKRMVI